MEAKERMNIHLAGLLLALIACRPGAAMVRADISNTRSASCLVKVTGDPTILPLNWGTIDSLLRSSTVAGKAIRDLLDISPSDLPRDVIQIEELDFYPSEGGLPSPPPMGTPAGPDFEQFPREPENDEYNEMMGQNTAPTPSTPATVQPDPSGGWTVDSPEQGDTGNATGAGTTTTATRPSASSRLTRPTSTGRPTGTRGSQTMRGSSRYTGSYSYSYGMPSSVTPRPSIGATTPSWPAGETIVFTLSINLPDSIVDGKNIKPAAEELMTALVDNLRNALFQETERSVKTLTERLNKAEREAERVQQLFLEIQQQLRDISGSRNLSRDTILNDTDQLRRQIEELRMKQLSDQVMLEATTGRIAETKKKMDEQLEKDVVTAEMEQMLKISAEQLAQMEEHLKQGVVGAAALDGPKMELAKVRIEIAKRREALSRSAGGDKIDSLNAKLADIALETTRLNAQMASLDRQLNQAHETLADSDKYELLSLKADIAKRNLQETLLWRDRMERQYRMLQPFSVSLIGEP